MAITILCHGTDNSTDVATSSGNTLVISRITDLLDGTEGKHWMLMEGAGTQRLQDQKVDASWLGGVVKGSGVEENVERARKFIEKESRASFKARDGKPGNRVQMTVNLAGHSRGSITCYKIAHALRNDPGIKINIFAIDPVPGNNGGINKEMYKHLTLGQNVVNSFLLLAESEHRLNFRPYVDALYCLNQPEHGFDTIPGTHGGINELAGEEHEAADIVLSRALKFLKKNGSTFLQHADNEILDEQQLLDRYSAMMLRIKEYKKHASLNLFKARSWDEFKSAAGNLATSSLQVEKHRIANVAGDKLTWGDEQPKGVKDTLKVRVKQAIGEHLPTPKGRSAHHGLNMSEAIRRMSGDKAHAKRTNRYFANQHHEKIFRAAYPGTFTALNNVERSADKELLLALAAQLPDYLAKCSQTERGYTEAYCQARING